MITKWNLWKCEWCQRSGNMPAPVVVEDMTSLAALPRPEWWKTLALVDCCTVACANNLKRAKAKAEAAANLARERILVTLVPGKWEDPNGS